MSEPNGENMDPLPAPGRSWLRPLAFGTVLLISGAVIGSALTVLAMRSQTERARKDPAWLSQRAAARLVHDLDLTTEQAEQVHEIFRAHHDRVRSFREQHGTMAREMFANLQTEIEEVLTPEQAEKWRKRIKRARERAMRNGARHDRGPRSGTLRRHERGGRSNGMRPNERFPRSGDSPGVNASPVDAPAPASAGTPPPGN